MSEYELEGWGWSIVRMAVLIPFLVIGFPLAGIAEAYRRIKHRKEWPV